MQISKIHVLRRNIKKGTYASKMIINANYDFRESCFQQLDASREQQREEKELK